MANKLFGEISRKEMTGDEARPFACKCQTLTDRVLGDGCDECNTELAKELEEDQEELSQSDLLAKHGYEKFAVATDGGTTIYLKGNFAVWLTLDGRILDSSPNDETAKEIHLSNTEDAHAKGVDAL